MAGFRQTLAQHWHYLTTHVHPKATALSLAVPPNLSPSPARCRPARCAPSRAPAAHDTAHRSAGPRTTHCPARFPSAGHSAPTAHPGQPWRHHAQTSRVPFGRSPLPASSERHRTGPHVRSPWTISPPLLDKLGYAPCHRLLGTKRPHLPHPVPGDGRDPATPPAKPPPIQPELTPDDEPGATTHRDQRQAVPVGDVRSDTEIPQGAAQPASRQHDG